MSFGKPLIAEQRKPLPEGASAVARYLLERREVLDRTLRQQDGSAMSTLMRRSPPTPAALVAIGSGAVRDRFLKLLQNANIATDVVEPAEAANALEALTHAVLFTDSAELIRRARSLHAGAATHVVFIDHTGGSECREAWRAGANDCMPERAEGEEFWARITTARRIVSLAASLQLALSDNRILSTVDELTGCGSRRFFEQEFPREVERAGRLSRPLTLVLCDIDHFKRINDELGHPAGDRVLSEFGERLREGLRLGLDWVARVGGEEFAIVLPETPPDEAMGIAERLRQRVRERPFAVSARRLPVTASFGLSGVDRGGLRLTPRTDSLVEQADRALYVSKGQGRDRVTACPAVSQQS